MDHLRNALQNALGPATTAAATPTKPAAAEAPRLPDPVASDWIALFRQLGGEVPRDPTMGQLVQRSDARARALADAGRGRDAAALKRARDEFVRDREKRAWALVKERFGALELSEKTYRALKQEEADPEKLLLRLTSRRAEELRGLGAARLREELTQVPPVGGRKG
jgi:hypothetical protein